MSNYIKDEIFKLLQPRLTDFGLNKEDVLINESLLSQGILDSVSFLEFLTEIESLFHIEIDFSDLDTSEFTSIEKLIKIVGNEN